MWISVVKEGVRTVKYKIFIGSMALCAKAQNRKRMIKINQFD